MDGVPLTIEKLIQVQVERFGVTQTSAIIISTSHRLWFQVYYSTPKTHAILLSLLFSPDQNKQVLAHLCITTVRYRKTPTHSTRSSKTALTVKRSVFTNISFLCLSPLDFSIIGKIIRVSRSPHAFNMNYYHILQSLSEMSAQRTIPLPVQQTHCFEGTFPHLCRHLLSSCISVVTFQKVWRKLVAGSEEEFQTDAPSSVLGCCMATVVLSQGLSLSLAHTATTAHKTTYFRERMFLTLVVLKKSLKI